MRSTAGILAGLLFVGVVVNCGGDDSNNNGGTAGTGNGAGENSGGDGGKASTAGSSSGGKAGSSTGAEGGMPPMTGCKVDKDCGAAQKCVEDVCKNDDGEACKTSDECVNTCIDDVCTSKKDDGEDCEADEDCAHTCIDNVCAPVSDVGGDCDAPVDIGAGGAGGAGSTGMGGMGAGGEASLPQDPDCVAPLQCYGGKCLTPDGEACKDNVDCINTCVNSVCAPKGSVGDKCDDTPDCAAEELVCDPVKKVCKLDTLTQCQTNDQCQSNRCVCSNPSCTTRHCKTPESVCQCRYSEPNTPTCDNNSPVLNQSTQDPNGCSGTKMCNSQGICVENSGGTCTQACTFVAGDPDTTADDKCNPVGAATGCKAGYDEVVTSACQVVKNTQTCTSTCACTLE
jgi:hypothetical protein